MATPRRILGVGDVFEDGSPIPIRGENPRRDDTAQRIMAMLPADAKEGFERIPFLVSEGHPEVERLQAGDVVVFGPKDPSLGPVELFMKGVRVFQSDGDKLWEIYVTRKEI